MTTQTIPKGWTITTLGEVAEIIKDQWNPGDAEQKYIGLEHISQGDLRINGYGFSSKLESNKFCFKNGDVLFGKLRPYFRKVWMATFSGICSTDIWVIRSKKGYDQSYLFYFMANPIVIDKSSGASTGTKMPRADWGFLGNTEWGFPNISEQKAIAAVLAALDDKIELLRKQNKTLENIAQTLFKRWFVDFEFPCLPSGYAFGAGKPNEMASVCTYKSVGGLPAPQSDKHFLYVLLCGDDSFYIGITDDLYRRWYEHKTGKGAKWTKQNEPIKVIHWEEFGNKRDAAAREQWLKTGFGRKWLKREYEAGRLRQAGKMTDSALGKIP
ncbi:MAG: GIY-YIG nuclease family protein, partial [Nitrospinae bacterium]|nr:GIY-YIG nuclease family protein [Nitrospinota bacterium]